MKVTIEPATAQAVAKALLTAVSKDKNRRHLQGVHVQPTEDGATLQATDGYRLHRVAVSMGGDVSADTTGHLLGGRELCKALSDAGKAAKKDGGTVSVIVADSCAQVTGGGFTVTVPVIVAEFPDTASLFDGSDDMETGAAFNGDYMGDAFQAAQLIAEVGLAGWQDSHGVTVQTMRVRKCARVTSRSGDKVPAVTFDALIMPQRVKG